MTTKQQRRNPKVEITDSRDELPRVAADESLPKEPSHVKFQTLDEVFQYELAKRSTNAGIAHAARAGDREYLKKFAGLAVVCIESATALPEIRDVLICMLCGISSGEEPNKEFGWSRKRRGNPSARTEFDKLFSMWLIGGHVAGLIAEDPNESRAFGIVSKARHASKEKVRDCWLRWQGKMETPR
jgi:hypothetical protein